MQSVAMSTLSTEKGGVIPANETAYWRMRDLWTSGQASTARVCVALVATPAPVSTFSTIGNASQNPMIGFSGGNAGLSNTPPVCATNSWDVSSEGRSLLCLAHRVGSGLNLLPGGTEVQWSYNYTLDSMRLRLNSTMGGGLTVYNSTAESSLGYAYGVAPGNVVPYASSTSNCVFATVEVKRISATRFSVSAVWSYSIYAVTGYMYLAGATEAAIAAMCEGIANGSISLLSQRTEWLVDTTTKDPSEVFAEFPFFALHNPCSFPLYVLHSCIFESM